MLGKYSRNKLHRAEQTDRDKGGERLQERNGQQSGRDNEKKREKNEKGGGSEGETKLNQGAGT